MNFELSNEQRDIQKAAMEFAKGEFDPDLAKELDQSGKFPHKIWKDASQLGFMGIHYPEDFGGQGWGFFENILVIEAFCRVDSGIGNALSAADLGSAVISKFGTNKQKKQYLIPLAQGEAMMGAGLAESLVGNDFSNVSTVAETSGGKYRLKGEKKSVTNALFADVFIILCREAEEGLMTLILRREEVDRINPVEKMGLRMIQFGDLHFNGTEVPLDRLVGRKGEGLLHANHLYQEMSLRSAAQALGVAQGAFERALEYAKQRELFRRKLSQFQITRHKLAELAVGIEIARCLTYKSAIAYDQGRLDFVPLAITQIEVSRRLFGMVYDAMQIFGGHGYMAEMDIEHYYRDAVVIGLDLGSEEELKDTIAERILGRS